MTFNGIQILIIILSIITLILLPFFVTDGWIGIIAKIISVSLISFFLLGLFYYFYNYYKSEDIPLNKTEARQILKEQKTIFKNKDITQLLQLLKEPQTFEIIRNDVTYQLEIEAYWEDKKRKDNLILLFSIDNGYRSAWHPMTESMTYSISPDLQY